uniref:ATP-dependent Clp protease proteolytic subunit n=1 Tax=Trifolium repens TaxID=3899 RepID=A0A023HQ73_TRIRP|nr:clp protease proteolytic subunit [Trifolium repens]AGO63653.1 clp protease proteolytic subunit [Trifolium repens]AJE72610.1 ATP-dependent Clp protease proteolytic subunit [Trifolium repens]QJQ79432.1 clp protease proteolytic subunit [Trifolium repens]WGN98308.1 ATP-dependent Clp protease proteolytic subunit [Trifolium repens]
MPVGVPKVPYLMPGDDEASWVDLYHRLYEERLLFLGQEVNSEISNQLSGLMIFLSLQDNTKDLYLFINSPGGEVISGMAMFDTMQFVKAEVQTVCVGLAASMASLLLLGGEITKRLAFPNARVMMHQPASSLDEEKTGECVLEADELLKMYKSIINIYVQRTGKPSWQIAKDMRRDLFMSAEEAQAHGIVDTVADSFN